MRAVAGWVRHAGLIPALVLGVGALVWVLPLAAAAAAPHGGAGSRHVVIVGIGGLLWSDVSPSATPTLWRLAKQGAVGSLDVSGVRERTCPAEGWLTLNGAARAALPGPAEGPCPAEPAVVRRPGLIAGGIPVAARVPGLGRIESYNARFHWDAQWGLLGTSPGRGRCVTAVGPGAALALASRAGGLSGYLPDPSSLSPVVGRSCAAS